MLITTLIARLRKKDREIAELTTQVAQLRVQNTALQFDILQMRRQENATITQLTDELVTAEADVARFNHFFSTVTIMNLLRTLIASDAANAPETPLPTVARARIDQAMA